MPATGLNRYLPDWSATSNPGVGAQASASQPASTAPSLKESRHVCTSVSATLVAAAATAAQATLNLRDGAGIRGRRRHSIRIRHADGPHALTLPFPSFGRAAA